MQCHVLERFLSLILATAGVEMRYGAEFLRIDDASDEGPVAVVRQRQQNWQSVDTFSTSSEVVRVPFMLLVGADGGHSAVRTAMGAAFLPQERFSLGPFVRGDPAKEHEHVQHQHQEEEKDGEEVLEVVGLNQTTLILSFEQQGRECPKLALHDDGAQSLPSIWCH